MSDSDSCARCAGDCFCESAHLSDAQLARRARDQARLAELRAAARLMAEVER